MPFYFLWFPDISLLIFWPQGWNHWAHSITFLPHPVPLLQPAKAVHVFSPQDPDGGGIHWQWQSFFVSPPGSPWWPMPWSHLRQLPPWIYPLSAPVPSKSQPQVPFGGIVQWHSFSPICLQSRLSEPVDVVSCSFPGWEISDKGPLGFLSFRM